MKPGIALTLAQQSCAYCHGLGLCATRGNGRTRPCDCVFRAIFRACYARFRTESQNVGLGARNIEELVDPEAGRPLFKPLWLRSRSDYVIDFVNVANRALAERAIAAKLFRYHYLLGADWKFCAPKLGLDRGEFFHETYRVQQMIGRACWETAPYALYPIDEYFTEVKRCA